MFEKSDWLVLVGLLAFIGMLVSSCKRLDGSDTHVGGVVKDDGATAELSYIDDPETGVRCFYFDRMVREQTLSCVQVRKGAEEILGAIELAERKREKQP